MTFGDIVKSIVGLIIILYVIWFVVVVGGVVFKYISKSWDNISYLIAAIVTILVSGIVILLYINDSKKKVESAEKDKEKSLSEQRQREREFNRLKKELEKTFSEITEETDNLENHYNTALKSRSPFSHVAEMVSDWETIIYDNTIHFLRSKKRPAIKKSEDVMILRDKTREAIRQYKEMRYKYLFLLDAFPELKRYVDDEEALKNIADYKDYEDFKAEGDEVLDYITTEEYKKMPEDERNQIALDRYKKTNKSNWQIGMQYEMYIGYLLRKSNMHVVQYGIENGLQDLGRDIIATRMENGVEVTYIVQCKNWSKKKDKVVHENVICQLFGTTVQYELTHKGLFNKVVPMLVISHKLSATAEEFAKRLGVMVFVRSLGDYPMIKCNINNGNKIYHLPFDQQYYRTQIKLPGEFYAWTVKEAEDAGFRRARKHLFNK